MEIITDKEKALELINSKTLIKEIHFKGIRFDKITLDGYKFLCCEFTDCDFIKCIVKGTKFKMGKFSDVRFTKCNLTLNTFINWGFTNNTSFDGCKIYEGKIKLCDFKDGVFLNTEIHDVYFKECLFEAMYLGQSNFTNTQLSRDNFKNSDIVKTLIK